MSALEKTIVSSGLNFIPADTTPESIMTLEKNLTKFEKDLPKLEDALAKELLTEMKIIPAQRIDNTTCTRHNLDLIFANSIKTGILLMQGIGKQKNDLVNEAISEHLKPTITALVECKIAIENYNTILSRGDTPDPTEVLKASVKLSGLMISCYEETSKASLLRTAKLYASTADHPPSAFTAYAAHTARLAARLPSSPKSVINPK